MGRGATTDIQVPFPSDLHTIFSVYLYI